MGPPRPAHGEPFRLVHPPARAAGIPARRGARSDVPDPARPHPPGSPRNPGPAPLGGVPPVCPLATRILPDGSPCRNPPGIACYREGCVGPGGLLRITVQTRAWSRWRSVIRMIVANSEAMAGALQDAGLPVNRVIRNGTREVTARPPLHDPPLAVYAGRLVATKGVDDLLAAFELVVDRVRRRDSSSSAMALIAGALLSRSPAFPFRGGSSREATFPGPASTTCSTMPGYRSSPRGSASPPPMSFPRR